MWEFIGVRILLLLSYYDVRPFFYKATDGTKKIENPCISPIAISNISFHSFISYDHKRKSAESSRCIRAFTNNFACNGSPEIETANWNQCYVSLNLSQFQAYCLPRINSSATTKII